eukprot:11214546-Lingulodinium_polyedra.AAC.1
MDRLGTRYHAVHWSGITRTVLREAQGDGWSSTSRRVVTEINFYMQSLRQVNAETVSEYVDREELVWN